MSIFLLYIYVLCLYKCINVNENKKEKLKCKKAVALSWMWNVFGICGGYYYIKLMRKYFVNAGMSRPIQKIWWACFLLGGMAYRNSWTLDASIGLWTLDAGVWTLDSGCWTLDAGHWTLGSGHWTLSLTVPEQNQNPVSDAAWLNYWIFFGCESLRTPWPYLFCRDCWF